MQQFLSNCRVVMIVPVIGCLLCSLAMVVLGVSRILYAGVKMTRTMDFSPSMGKTVSLAVIEIIDLFLVGTVAYITAIGLYKLFINSSAVDLPMRLKIRNLSDLENKIIGVIVAALAVSVLGKATSDYDEQSLLYYGVGIALVITALALFVFLTQDPSGKKADTVPKAESDPDV